MIFVSVGSSPIPFDRLVRAVEAFSGDERLVIQHGPSPIRPKRAECVDFLAYDAFVELVRDARVIVTHAGVGSVIAALAERKRPVVIPRRQAFGEAVDDHQVSFARRASELGFVTVVEDVDRLPSAIAGNVGCRPSPGLKVSPIESELRAYIEDCLGPPRSSEARTS